MTIIYICTYLVVLIVVIVECCWTTKTNKFGDTDDMIAEYYTDDTRKCIYGGAHFTPTVVTLLRYYNARTDWLTTLRYACSAARVFEWAPSCRAHHRSTTDSATRTVHCCACSHVQYILLPRLDHTSTTLICRVVCIVILSKNNFIAIPIKHIPTHYTLHANRRPNYI